MFSSYYFLLKIPILRYFQYYDLLSFNLILNPYLNLNLILYFILNLIINLIILYSIIQNLHYQ